MKRRDTHNQLRDALLGARRKRGLTQVEIASLLDKPQSFVSKYESGERRLDVIEFLQICQALQVKPATIIRQLESDDD